MALSLGDFTVQVVADTAEADALEMVLAAQARAGSVTENHGRIAARFVHAAFEELRCLQADSAEGGER